VGALNPEWQIETKDGEAGSGKRFGHFEEEFRLAVCARAVREDDDAVIWLCGSVKEATQRRIGNEIGKRGKHRIVYSRKPDLKQRRRGFFFGSRDSIRGKDFRGGFCIFLAVKRRTLGSDMIF
jgi:hypothetical protein